MVQPVQHVAPSATFKDAPAPALQPSYANLLQELGYALAGVTGDVFIDSVDVGVEQGHIIRSPQHSAFAVNPEVDWLSSCDKKQIEGILSLGFHYCEIDCFVQQPPGAATTGVCWEGLRAGLHELCVVYQSAVLRVERHVLTDCTATIASIQFYLSEYVNILPGVHTVLYEIMTLPNRTDAAVMSLLYDRAQCGNPSLKAVLERLLWNCNQVMYTHLRAWLFHGVLLDTSFRFFITCSDRPQDGSAKGRQSPEDEACDTAVNTWTSFKLQQANVPKYIPSPSAAHILDIGRAVRLLSQPPDSLNAFNTCATAADDLPDIGATAAVPLPQLGRNPTLPQPGYPRTGFRGAPPAAEEVAGAAAGPSGDGSQDYEAGAVRLDLDALSRSFQKIAAMPRFSSIAFETAITEIHEQVSKEVCSLVVRHAGLISHLKAIKDYLLLGRGDVFWMFLDASAQLLAKPPDASTATLNLQRAFNSAASRTGVDSTPEFSRVTISWQPPPDAPRILIASGMHAHIPSFFCDTPGSASWNDVAMAYSPPWPLPLLFTREVMDVYRVLFRYLLAVERSSRALDEVWQHVMTHMRSSRRSWTKQSQHVVSGGAQSDARARLLEEGADGGVEGESSTSRNSLGVELVGHACAAAVLRHRMDCVVRHLKGYLGDVVTRLFAEAEEEMVSAKTFVEVQNAHENLLTNLKLQTFLTSPHMCEVIEALLQGCGMLCKVVTEGQAYPLEEIASRFEDNTIAFLKQLSELHMQSRYTWGSRISHLLLHLDFLGRRDMDE